jgi:hypothetical protein
MVVVPEEFLGSSCRTDGLILPRGMKCKKNVFEDEIGDVEDVELVEQ